MLQSSSIHTEGIHGANVSNFKPIYMNQDTKTITIWILAIALIIVTGFLIREVRKPDSLASFTSELALKRQDVKEKCKDISTNEKRDTCMSALDDVNNLIGDIK